MSTTTQILFNSPALHSLKRDQLVKLCKIHSIKANGKNVDLIERLKKHAQTLSENGEPVEDEEIMDTEKENESWKMPRPSEQWEVVMESIEEEEGSSKGTMSSIRTVSGNENVGEFGTGGTKANSVSSSIRALATSLGLKRNPSSKSNIGPSSSQTSVTDEDELARHAIPYSSLPFPNPDKLPQTDHFTLSTSNDIDVPVPGQGNRVGRPAPENARLSTSGAVASTTIRLVSTPFGQGEPGTPQLKPFETTFDLLPGTPGGGNIWPASPSNNQRLYPDIPIFDPPIPIRPEKTQLEEDVDMPGGLSPPRFLEKTPSKASIQARGKLPSSEPLDIFSPAPKPRGSALSLPRSEPFIFGSPLPQNNVSNVQFRSAANSVLEEMNKRLAEAGVARVELDLLDRAANKTKTGASTGMEDKKTTIGEKFDKVHEGAFEKMDSITNHYAAKRPSPNKKRKSSALGVGDGRGPTKRKSSIGTRAAGARVISNGVRKKMVPGGFDDEEEDEEEEEDQEVRRLSKRPRVESEAFPVQETVKRVSIAPVVSDNKQSEDSDEKEREDRRKQKEREAVKRKLEINKARRRSSMGRVSVGGGKMPLVPNPKAKSRFGFLSSAKSVVQSFWGKGSSKPQGSNIPVPKAASKPPVEVSKTAKNVSISKPSAARPSTSRVVSGGSTSSRFLKPPTVGSMNGTLKSNATTSTSRSRSPIPSFDSTSTRNNTTNTRGESSIGVMGRKNSVAGVSSIGTKTGGSKAGANVSSLGVRGSLASGSINGTAASSTTGKRSSTSSRLMAPTASSLAKMSRPSTSQTRPRVSGMPGNSNSNKTNGTGKSVALDQNTNSPLSPRSPRGLGSIFSKPLTATSPGSAIPTPVRTHTFGTAAAALAQTQADSKPPIPPKPKILPGRRPRVSRSKVIAKLASQRAAASGPSALVPARPSSRTRSSIGAGVRQSVGGVKAGRTSGGGGVVMSAKKRARQSEYMRRRSKAARVSALSPRVRSAMDVDDD